MLNNAVAYPWSGLVLRRRKEKVCHGIITESYLTIVFELSVVALFRYSLTLALPFDKSLYSRPHRILLHSFTTFPDRVNYVILKLIRCLLYVR
jgi:hypothetical protein